MHWPFKYIFDDNPRWETQYKRTLHWKPWELTSSVLLELIGTTWQHCRHNDCKRYTAQQSRATPPNYRQASAPHPNHLFHLGVSFVLQRTTVYQESRKNPSLKQLSLPLLHKKYTDHVRTYLHRWLNDHPEFTRRSDCPSTRWSC